MMRFLIDVNLPEKFALWHGKAFTHVRALDDEMSDEAIWEYAKTRDLIVVTKDADFSNRLMRDGPPPSIVHVRVGNMRIREFHQHLDAIWPEVVELLTENALVNVFVDRIEAISI